MKQNNIIALALGVLCAGLLWQYYLYPKYNKKVQDPQTMQALLEADSAALDEELSAINGELLYRTDQPLPSQTSEQNKPVSFVEDPSIEKEKISMIKAPAKVRVIKTASEYDKVKNLILLNAQSVDFTKEMLILLESDTKLNDGFFQIKDINNDGEKITVSYSFNIIGAQDRAGKISAQKTLKSDLPIILQQVL